MKILFCGDSWNGDDSFLEHFARLPALQGTQVKTTMTKRENATEVALICKKNEIGGVVCSQRSLLEAALRNLRDLIPPPNKKQITLDDYAGSWIELPYGVPMVVVNPLERLNTVPFEKHLLNRYVSKLTQAHKWFQQLPFKWKQVHEHAQAEALSAIQEADLVAIDIETGIDDPHRRITCVAYCCYSFSSQECITLVVHFNSEWAWRFVQKANDSAGEKIFQNGNYDNSYFLRWNAPVRNWLWDTMTLMHCWYSEFPKRLDFITSYAIRKVRYWKQDGKTGSLEDLFRYNALDAWATLNSFLSMMSEIPPYVRDNYLQEFPMNFPALNAAMEGIDMDMELFDEVKAKKDAEAEGVLNRLRNIISAPEFNPRSPKQMMNLFTLLGCGDLSGTGKAEMLKARAASPLNDMLLGLGVKYREATKLISSYLNKEKIWNNRWYYTIDMAGTDSGRGASRASPFWCGDNIQNIPRGDVIKQLMRADKGWLFAEADKAQSEARCVGYLSGDEKLISLVESPRDYHSWNAAEFFGIAYEKIYDEAKKKTLDKELRDLSKRTNHGANYNMGKEVMLDTMGPKHVTRAKLLLKLPAGWRLTQVCQFLLDRYAETYPKVKGLYYDWIINTITTTSRLVSPLGWTRYFFAKPSRKNKPALNAAVAHPSQNLSVAIINKEWYAIWHETLHGTLRGLVRIKAQIHDSILFQYRVGYDPHKVLEFMKTPVQVVGADGVERTMLIPSDLKSGDERWSNLE